MFFLILNYKCINMFIFHGGIVGRTKCIILTCMKVNLDYFKCNDPYVATCATWESGSAYLPEHLGILYQVLVGFVFDSL